MRRQLVLAAVAALLASLLVACDNPAAPSEMGEPSHRESGSGSGESGTDY